MEKLQKWPSAFTPNGIRRLGAPPPDPHQNLSLSILGYATAYNYLNMDNSWIIVICRTKQVGFVVFVVLLFIYLSICRIIDNSTLFIFFRLLLKDGNAEPQKSNHTTVMPEVKDENRGAVISINFERKVTHANPREPAMNVMPISIYKNAYLHVNTCASR